MRIKEGQIFNLMDTNGRRNDVINALQGWKAVAAVPLQSSNDKDKFTDNVVIMPVNTDELSSLIDKSSEYDEIISKVHKLFEVDKINFDIEWREKFMGAII